MNVPLGNEVALSGERKRPSPDDVALTTRASLTPSVASDPAMRMGRTIRQLE